MLNKIFIKQSSRSLLTSIITMILSFSATAELFNAYPGKYKSTLINVEAANVVYLSVDIWTGYPRNLRITLPGIVVPDDNPQAPDCQRALVEKAFVFTNEFMNNAQFIEIRDIKMEATNEEDASTDILTNEGSLSSKLIESGFARPSSVKKNQPWC